jgi:hypothetical protein
MDLATLSAMAKPPAASGLADEIVRVLAPYLGPNMARAIARVQCDKLGIQGARVDPTQAASLENALRPGLVVFVGRDQTERILKELLAALSEREGHDHHG